MYQRGHICIRIHEDIKDERLSEKARQQWTSDSNGICAVLNRCVGICVFSMFVDRFVSVLLFYVLLLKVDT